MSTTTSVLARRRKPMPGWLQYLVKGLIFGVILPLTKLFPRCWARFVSRSMTKFLGRFPSYAPRPEDVFICSYFKSGTNWTMQMAVQIAHRGRAEFEHIHNLVAWPDIPDRARYAVEIGRAHV